METDPPEMDLPRQVELEPEPVPRHILPFNLFQPETNVVMLNETLPKSKPLILNLNLILLKMHTTNET